MYTALDTGLENGRAVRTGRMLCEDKMEVLRELKNIWFEETRELQF
jgi:hypothetical protein